MVRNVYFLNEKKETYAIALPYSRCIEMLVIKQYFRSILYISNKHLIVVVSMYN